VTPGPLDLALFCSIGLIGGISQYWMTQALHHAPAAAISPFNYVALIWGSILGFLIWGDVPTAAVAFGAVIITVAGFSLLRHEA
jgi:drug/metabolite transporter (DMT)-like permease